LLGLLALAAAPALSSRPYVPTPVEFEVDPPVAAPVPGPSPAVVSASIKAPKRFNIVGIRSDADRIPDLAVRVRKAGSDWSEWVTVEQADSAPDPNTREARAAKRAESATEPIWAGEADFVQYRAPRSPGDVKLEFINTSGTSTGSERFRTSIGMVANRALLSAVSVFSSNAGAAAAKPSMVSRSGWGGDRYCPPRTSPSYGQAKMAFIHHTVNANAYSASEAPSMVLGICRYHRNTLGWNDIGYNFLVDRYGKIYEGRAGGTGRSVVGAQTQGFNSSSTGIANLGTHTSSPQTSSGMDAMARLLRWKLDVHGLPRGGYATVTSGGGSSNRYPAGRSVTFKRISGHRDAGYTTCPGDALYAQLPALRRMVEAQADTTAPSAPQNLAVSSGPGRVALNWSDNGEADLAGYRIYRRTPDTSYSSIATTTSSAYTDRAVRGGETYYYRVKAYDGSGNHSASSNYATGRPWVPYEQVVDNGDSPTFEASASWRTSSRNASRYGADYRYAWPDSVSDAARFRLRVPRSGSYAVYVWHPAHADYSSSAPIGVQTSVGTKWAHFDLRSHGGRWREVGTFSLAAGAEPVVQISRWTSAPGWLIADAVRVLER
jgi:hypothetical protein